MAASNIEWTDRVWNPTVGCDKVSEGCRICYAMRLAYRLAAMGQKDYGGLTKKLPDGSVNWTGTVRVLQERLAIPFKWKKPARIFVDSMSDLFHEYVPDEFIARVFGVMASLPQHTFQVLTKRPERMQALIQSWVDFPSFPAYEPPKNIWLGTSVEDQRAADERVPLLLQTPAAVRFLSCEPLIGPVDLQQPWPDRLVPGSSIYYPWMVQQLDWVIAGGESGPNFRPLDLDWARSLRDQCQAAGVAFHFKQHGGRTHAAGGRLLDGRTWDEFPDTKGAA